MRNPYIIGGVVRQHNFYDRQALVEDLLDQRHECIYLVGNRRMGKTSLLRHLEDHASCVTLFVDLQATGGDPVKMGIEFAKQFKRKARQTPALRDLRFDTNYDICDSVETLAEFAEGGGFQVLLLWDEAEALLSLSKDYLERLRSVLHNRRTLRTILAATKGLSELNDKCRSWKTSPFLLGFAVRHIPPFNSQEAMDLICQVKNPEGSVQIGEDLLAQITNLTGNHPYLIQLLCDRLFQPAGRLCSPTDRDLVVDDALADLLQIDYDMLSHSERAVLRRLSELNTGGEDELCRSLGLQVDKLRSHLYGLEQLGYIHCRDGCYQVANHFLRTWLKMGYVRETPEVVSDQASLEVADIKSSKGGNSMLKQSEFTHGYALLVGVGCYKESRLSVPVTAQDAEDLGQVLTDPQWCAYPKNQVVVLANENANKADILGKLDALKARVKGDSNSTVIIFFSGHGWHKDGYHFLPYETETFYVDGKLEVKLDTALANEDFLNKVRRIPAQRLVILFNTCFAGGVGTALSPEIEQLPEFAPVPLGLYDELLEGSGRVIISSSKADEKSWVIGGANNSLFVTHLLSAFRGKGIKGDGKTINILDVFKYLSKTVPADVKTVGIIQTPVMQAYDITQDFPIALLRGGQGLSPESDGGSSVASDFEPGAQALKPAHMSRKNKQELVNALLLCPTMSDRGRRDAVVDDLPGDIRANIPRSSIDRVDISNIVSTCLNYANGIDELVEIMRGYEGNSIGIQEVDELLSQV